ncbi:MAG: hypothetical protein H8E44_03605 [Planctomycetes bacterium]|nr:hypothetical protein [Planctomycetota bacterium]MBL7043198.1 hypothetical protein [Pirellulaceae bacterium]
MEVLRSSLCISAFICFFISVVVIALFCASTQAKRRDHVWQQLATRYGGILAPGGISKYPSVRFRYADTSVLVDTYSTGGKNATVYIQIHFHWPDRQFRLEVYPEGVFARIRKFFGMEDIQIGAADFDPQYIISGSDFDEVRNLLDPHVRLAIRQLRASGITNDIYVSLVAGHLLVKKRRWTDDYEELRLFTDLALQLYEQALLTRAAGITFVKQEAAFSLDEAICRICGEPVAGDAAICRRCRTPHHRECWQYYGACSTYGCRETRFLVTKKKKAARDAKRAS